MFILQSENRKLIDSKCHLLKKYIWKGENQLIIIFNYTNTRIHVDIRGHRKINLITLNVKLTLRGRGVSHGFGIDVKKNNEKNE